MGARVRGKTTTAVARAQCRAETSGRYESKLVLSQLRVNPKSGGARKDWVCWDPFDKSKTLLHRLAARVKLAMQGHRSVLQEGGFDQY